jgi:predicted alpha/beta hydrolase family esterase
MVGRRRFLVLHGWQNRRPVRHWQWQLVESLRSAGEQVLYPQFPEPDRPDLGTWVALARAELAQLGSGERVVLAHSLAVPLWLRVAQGLDHQQRVDRVLLVAPPSPVVLARHAEVAAFATVPHDRTSVSAASASTRMVCGDDDPYCPEGAPVAYADLGLDCDIIRGGRHLDPDAGYGPWPSIRAWCLDPTGTVSSR